MKLSLCLPGILLFLGAGACHSTGATLRPTSPDDALLREVSAGQRSNVAAARKVCDQAADAHAAAQADAVKAGEAQVRAGLVRDASAATVGRTATTLTQATASGTTAEVDTAKQAALRAEADLKVQDAQVVLSDKQVVYANAFAALAKEHIKVAEAGVELAKVKAVNTLDRPESQKPDVIVFEGILRRAEGEAAIARTRSEAAQKEVTIATVTLEQQKASVKS